MTEKTLCSISVEAFPCCECSKSFSKGPFHFPHIIATLSTTIMASTRNVEPDIDVEAGSDAIVNVNAAPPPSYDEALCLKEQAASLPERPTFGGSTREYPLVFYDLLLTSSWCFRWSIRPVIRSTSHPLRKVRSHITPTAHWRPLLGKKRRLPPIPLHCACPCVAWIRRSCRDGVG
jgi:hypothetical protein